MTDQSDILRVFADPKKVRLLGQLCDEALPLHTLARAVGLSEAETMGLVRPLKAAGLLEETFGDNGFLWRYRPQAIFDILRASKAEAAGANDLPDGVDAFDAKVLGDFLVGGRLKQIPAQQKKKDVVLRYLAQRFELGRAYPEQEVNFLLLEYHEDYATLRRALVDGRLMERENGIYRRVGAGRLV